MTSRLARACAMALVLSPFVPLIKWYGSDSSGAESITMLRAVAMHLGHHYEAMYGAVVFMVVAPAGFVGLLARSTLTRKAAHVALAIAVFELFLVLVPLRYGDVGYGAARFFGIRGMIPPERYLPHTMLVLAAASAWSAVERNARRTRKE